MTGVVPSSTSHSHVIHALISQDNVTRLASHMHEEMDHGGPWVVINTLLYMQIYQVIKPRKK